MAATSLATLAGAHGELGGVLMMRAYHLARGDSGRTKMGIPDSAHGTNPASAAMAGFDVVTIPSDADGNTDLAALREIAGDDLAGVMITLPSTLGLFDSQHPGGVPGGPRVRRPGVRRRRQHERPAGPGQAGRTGLSTFAT